MSLDHELKSEAQKGIEAHLIKRVLSETCRKHANSIVDADIAFEPKGTNVFVGIGLATQNRISAGLGLGIIPMACVAADIQADMRRMGLASSLVVLIADQHALAKHSDPPKTAEIHRVAESVQKSAERLFGFLGVAVQIITATNYLWPNIDGGYVARETTDIVHAHESLGCGIKVGWQTNRKPLHGGAPLRDERWFDAQAKTIAGTRLEHMSFVRTAEWMSRKTQLDPKSLPKKSTRIVEQFRPIPYGETEVIRKQISINTSPQHLPLPPYIGEPGFHLGLPMRVAELVQKEEVTNLIVKALSGFDSTLKKTLRVQTKTAKWELLQRLIDACAAS
ncbi:MAG: hypothetical protein UV61_C0012G0007 [Candidatus Gottesmanbacteria bacterium GW2011_GWB1_43_11]|uniref:Uncharacterized protein n=1 Tax=Candidatus Gottesmanbacteria bacterium GW2011_GWB1_43_11 TaxID=1618446 RepID=A0A0G1CK56_9BACT|nr:MAG: hypothetical protein UV04_C0024G0017 [Candidatus Gottesmanbacteria bacterium GW2011_GWA2_42_16]KKS53635.1 MAG: hypothetical protein UV17_C0033G0010 [Candidatus Gottesmanbacteria bacterium GW2011_GWA1_42_26]KKS81081.1 MAG: hypothetical protein UV55_C0022G0007 [Candidatus Gottesmanbacteria bacterium GW2011_GWC1_43_10]KKS86180.1 MAG: hypothetical protein UV61_C0012G0007 [Candidatus Gottesmanbacteria bacterium GW2011_GWB1_43_11]OGG10284.1 MAG: hypothetical protein A2699_00120 [Candidatus Go